MVEKKLLTPADVKRLYGLSDGQQSAMRARKEIPYVDLGPRRPRYLLSDLEAFFAARSVPAK